MSTPCEDMTRGISLFFLDYVDAHLLLVLKHEQMRALITEY